MVGRLLGYGMLVAGLVLLISVHYLRSPKSEVPIVFAPKQMLAATWLTYKQHYVEEDTYRTVDTTRDNITTSEGQSYTMLRAVWMGDKTTFDGAWRWTKEHLEHEEDALFAWKWGTRADGTEGVLFEESGNTSASDADVNIALALVFAYARWQDDEYLREARTLIDSIWEEEVLVVGGVPYLAANNLEKGSSSAWAVVNPSYLNPAAFRIFAQVDRTHAWDALADSSHDLLAQSMRSTLDTGTTKGLPPNWLELNKTTGAIRAVAGGDVDTRFGFDAMRVPLMLALDAVWFKSERADSTLKNLAFLTEEWRRHGTLASVYTHDGAVIDATETPAMYGGVIGYFMRAHPAHAAEVYTNKLLPLYNPGANTWRVPLSYYDDNLAWFGIALYNDALPNLAAELPKTAFTE
jgi:endoglucanase